MGRIGAVLACTLWLISSGVPADEAAVHYRSAKQLRDQGRYDEALVEIDKAIDERPTYAQGHMTRGTILRRMGKYEGALRSFERAIDLEPKNGRAYGLAGAALLRLDRPKDAAESLQKAIVLDPKDKTHWLNLGLAYRRSKNDEAAIAVYRTNAAEQPGRRPAEGTPIR